MAERRKPMQAQDKLAFLLALVPYLMDRDRVSVAEAAEHFGVEQEQLRDAVRLIAVSGIPGETNAYQPGDLFDIAWDDFEENDQIVLTHQVAIDDSPRFSAREAAALIAGLQYLTALPENADRDAIGSLMAKLARGASAAPSQLAVARSETDEVLATIRDAVIAGVQVEFDYLSSRGEHERRRVDPLRIESVDQDWYLRGWDHLRTAIRTFRLDRIDDLVATQESITYRPGDVKLPETLFTGTDEDQLVTVDVSASAIRLIEDYIPEGAEREDRGGVIRTSVRVAHFHGLKRLVAGLSGVLTVLDPPEARQVVAGWARAGAERYTGSQNVQR
ncbi:helix-turn-helix transcriptional regulator [Leifsonia sp. RAF41]|uniref:helix-turn-helix transcriptional regulator n=1 Tax=Leifsonia sp. RAF41 TaxID=3233056 RepID=UPI003F9DA10A